MSSYRRAVLRLGRTRAGTAARAALGGRRVQALRVLVLPRSRSRRSVRATLAERRAQQLPSNEPRAVLEDGRWVVTDPHWSPQRLREDNLARTAAALVSAGVPHVLLRTSSPSRYTLAVSSADQALLTSALARAPDLRSAQVQLAVGSRSVGRAVPAAAAESIEWGTRRVVRVYRRVRSAPGAWTVGQQYACDVELWEEGEVPGIGSPMSVGPRSNVASNLLPIGTLEDTEPHEIGGRVYARPRVFSQVMLEDVTFDIDVVCTWVDGADPAWRERMSRTRARVDGVELHPESSAPNRFASRDELRYSLRSIRSYAPWIRHVWLVTDQQRPHWLAEETPGLTLVDHRDIVDDPSVLPLFNSNAIISRLHHIPGLAEHYLYLNDDMFLGHDVRPNAFFHPSGVARLFPAKLHRPFGPASVGDEPHVNLSRNIRALLEERFGVTITRAIRHTPYPQLRSRQLELEELFPRTYAEVLQHPFRHHDDVAADQLLHYYLQVVGAGVPSAISYDYVNVGVAEEEHRLERLLRSRNRAVFCLNDAPQPGTAPMPSETIQAFLEAYFPVPSTWERPTSADS